MDRLPDPGRRAASGGSFRPAALPLGSLSAGSEPGAAAAVGGTSLWHRPLREGHALPGYHRLPDQRHLRLDSGSNHICYGNGAGNRGRLSGRRCGRSHHARLRHLPGISGTGICHGHRGGLKRRCGERGAGAGRGELAQVRENCQKSRRWL